MAKRILTQRVDDLDGTDLDQLGRPVRFGLDGKSYEIDLSEANVAVLRAALEPFVSKARRPSRARSGRRV